MDAKEVLKLIDAGFRAEEIRALMPEQKTDEKPATGADTKETKKTDPEKAAKEEDKKPDEKEEDKKPDKSDKILDAIDRLTGSITTFMITSTGRATPDETTTVDEILGKILFPDGEEAK